MEKGHTKSTQRNTQLQLIPVGVESVVKVSGELLADGREVGVDLGHF